MREGILVRRSEPDDFDAWSALFGEVAAEGRWIGQEPPLDAAWARCSFNRGLDGTTAVTLLALDGDELVGLLGVTTAGGVAELGMMVRAGRRREGIGSTLLTGCLDWARDRGCHEVALSVWPHNEAAIALYERHGFVVEGRLVQHWRRRDGALWDLVLMRRVL